MAVFRGFYWTFTAGTTSKKLTGFISLGEFKRQTEQSVRRAIAFLIAFWFNLSVVRSLCMCFMFCFVVGSRPWKWDSNASDFTCKLKFWHIHVNWERGGLVFAVVLVWKNVVIACESVKPVEPGGNCLGLSCSILALISMLDLWLRTSVYPWPPILWCVF